MQTTRRKFTAEFKAKVAIEALQERESISFLSKKYDLHPNVINGWKKDFKENGSKVFSEPSKGKEEKDVLIDELYKEIGRWISNLKQDYLLSKKRVVL